MSNQIDLTFRITRKDNRNVYIELFRHGQGDDKVEQRADEIEQCVKDYHARMEADYKRKFPNG